MNDNETCHYDKVNCHERKEGGISVPLYNRLKEYRARLNVNQQEAYDAWIQERNAEARGEIEESKSEEEELSGDTQIAGQVKHADEEPDEEPAVTDAPTMELPEVKTVDVGQYNTINLQMALAESMKEILNDEPENEEKHCQL